MLIDTSMIANESLAGVTLPLGQPAPKSRVKLTPDQRTRLEFLLKKLRIFGEPNRYHNAAFIESLLNAGEDRRQQFSPSTECLAAVEVILALEAPAASHAEEQLLDGHLPILPGKDTMAAD
jgi:hypothetical protein